MRQALELTLLFPTMPLTILLAFVLVYWVISATGMLGDHADHDFGGDHHLTDNVGLAAWLDRFGFSSVPLVFVLSIMVLFMWVMTYAIHANFLADVSDTTRWTVGTIVLVGSFIVSLVPVAMVLVPLRWFLRKVSVSTTEERNIRGHEGEVVSPQVDGQGGRVSVSSSAQGAVMILSAKSLSGGVYPLGTPIVVVSYDEQEKCCQVVSREEFLSDPPTV